MGRDSFRGALKHARWCGAVRGVLTALGPGWVKAAQIFATREDLLPADWCRTLRAAVCDTGDGLGSVASVDVNRGSGLAVKHIRRSSRKRLLRNVASLRALAWTCERVWRDDPAGVALVMRDVADCIAQQVDVAYETEMLGEASRLLNDASLAMVPEVVEVISAADFSMTAMPEAAARPRERDDVEALLDVTFRLIFGHGIVHCDLHPGNWWPVEGGIAVIDFGFAKRMTTQERLRFMDFFFGLSVGSSPQCAEAFMASGVRPPTAAQEEEIRQGLRHLVRKTHGLRSSDFSLPAFTRELFELQRAARFPTRSSFIFPIISLLAVEGQLKAIDPDYDFQARARPILTSELVRLRHRTAGDRQPGSPESVTLHEVPPRTVTSGRLRASDTLNTDDPGEANQSHVRHAPSSGERTERRLVLAYAPLDRAQHPCPRLHLRPGSADDPFLHAPPRSLASHRSARPDLPPERTARNRRDRPNPSLH